jgi:dihydropteroate synthase
MSRNESRIDFFQPQVMAIVNVTDDSFYEGSRTHSDDAIVERVREVVEQGATIVDVGGYSSRPGAKDISVEEEWQRVERGLQAVRSVSKDVAVSVDTFRAEVAELAIKEFGDVIINDISAGELSPRMIDVVADAGVPYVAMHMRGTPQTMQQNTSYSEGVVAEVCRYFEHRVEYLLGRGVKDIILDPGFGFAKSAEQNFELLAHLSQLCALGYPVLAGLSRKSMIYKTLGVTAAEALAGTVALNWEALRQGATILRVHDVREAADVVQLYKKISQL